jgi:hypothetical protein
LQPALHRRTREFAVEPRLHMKKTVEADELARFVKADRVAHPAEQRNIGDAVVSAHHPVATREPFVEDAEQPRGLGCVAVAELRKSVPQKDQCDDQKCRCRKLHP